MQLGTRWDAGAEPPARLPDAVLDLIQQAEAYLPGSSTAATPRWTLTWLEGQPHLGLDGGYGIEPVGGGYFRLTAPDGELIAPDEPFAGEDDDDDDWLEDEPV